MSNHASENGNLHEAALDILAKRLAKKADIAEEQARQCPKGTARSGG